MLIKRQILSDLISHLDKNEITLLVGPRQAGKTTLMFALIDEIKRKKGKCLYLSLDNENDRRFFSTQADLLEKISLSLGKSKGFVLIDEIQRKSDAGLFLKGIYDMRLPYKFIVTGSGSLELKEKVSESLVGRKRLFEIYPLTFAEFVDFKTDYRYNGRLRQFLKVESDSGLRLLNEYLSFGGYPKLVLAETTAEKELVIEDIFKSFIEKDIRLLLRAEKSDVFADLLRILASQSGKLTNYTELSNTLNLSQQTVRKYLWYLEKTFIVEKSLPLFKNIRKEITKSPIYYFTDFGLRNYALGVFGKAVTSQDGFLFQNFVFNELRGQPRKFWRTKQGAEIDIVLDQYPRTIPVEVKFTKLKEIRLGRFFNNYLKKYLPERAYLVNLDFSSTMEMGKTLVRAVPYFKLDQIS